MQPNLSKAQLKVMNLVAEGLSNREVAQRLGITESTVGYHLIDIYKALGVKKRVLAVMRWTELTTPTN